MLRTVNEEDNALCIHTITGDNEIAVGVTMALV